MGNIILLYDIILGEKKKTMEKQRRKIYTDSFLV